MSTEKIACSLELCQCVQTAQLDPAGKDAMPTYCSDYCRDADEGHERLDYACACGHPPCDEP